ncbi:UNVERIFIED_CONTAM: hypothetical protein Slati_3478600 [Sesamum latifolium]|uniref:Reverse transcriptase domain-containing protein n=1 Tax=Sesamum latifolium TaxID=2727402 RepID=A0AAW2UIG8_9LAMI
MTEIVVPQFFHSCASTWQRQNMIRRLRDEEGVWREREEDIQGILLCYFQEIFTSNGPPESVINEVLSLVQPRVTPEMNQVLATPFTTMEVKTTIFGMFPFKSPGHDGMPPVFFHKFWSIVASDETRDVLRILNDHVMLNKMNYTHIVLIPKCEAPETSAFIQGRLITDNVLLAFELNHYLQSSRRSIRGRIALKLDMSKAYDRVEWAFLRGTLLRLGFNHRFVALVMLLVTPVSYFLILNEVFSCLIQDAEGRGRLMGVSVAPQAPRVSHLLFVDDTLVFCEGTTEQIREVRWILQVYARASGQEINLQKSTMVISGGVPMAVKHLLFCGLGWFHIMINIWDCRQWRDDHEKHCLRVSKTGCGIGSGDGIPRCYHRRGKVYLLRSCYNPCRPMRCPVSSYRLVFCGA